MHTDYVYLADTEGSIEKKLAYARKALEENPRDTDAKRIIACCTATTEIDFLEKIKSVIRDAEYDLREDGYFEKEYEGRFYRIPDTRPYMRARHHYVLGLIRCGMLGIAVAECEDCIRLNKDDNLGFRKIAMHIYSALEDETHAEILRQRYPETTDAHFLLPLAFLYFKRAEFSEAKSVIKTIRKINRGFTAFVRDYENGMMEEAVNRIDLTRSYTVNSKEELVFVIAEFPFLYCNAEEFFTWARSAR